MAASKYSPELQSQLVALLRLGNYRNTACAYVGISPSTLAQWISDGRNDPGGEYGTLPEAIEKAEADCEVESLGLIMAARQTHWTAAAWYLERKYPQRYARRDRSEVTGPNGGPVPVVASAEVVKALDYATVEELEVFKAIRDRARDAEAARLAESGDASGGG